MLVKFITFFLINTLIKLEVNISKLLNYQKRRNISIYFPNKFIKATQSELRVGCNKPNNATLLLSFSIF